MKENNNYKITGKIVTKEENIYLYIDYTFNPVLIDIYNIFKNFNNINVEITIKEVIYDKNRITITWWYSWIIKANSF